MHALLGRIGGGAARHPWRTLAAWLLVLAAFVQPEGRIRRPAPRSPVWLIQNGGYSARLGCVELPPDGSTFSAQFRIHVVQIAAYVRLRPRMQHCPA
jgi:hypothetical protein